MPSFELESPSVSIEAGMVSTIRGYAWATQERVFVVVACLESPIATIENEAPAGRTRTYNQRINSPALLVRVVHLVL